MVPSKREGSRAVVLGRVGWACRRSGRLLSCSRAIVRLVKARKPKLD
ncbi:hypothetical protein AKJ09_10699 [Labilithrix luteola]|uniref:Uncharacterized protein n=1 Tax=Labilithrix luteola TaxID=1391654 RepID=A0A0K1QE38_9BACT|nr:hypothetical protein AKJ09_10699 [Labilithrix luteola]